MLRRLRTLAVALAPLAACATTPPPPPPAAPAAPAAPTGTLAPPPLAAEDTAPAARDDDMRPARSKIRRAIFEAAWQTVRDKHYDKTLGGVDWDEAKRRYEPLALAAPDEASFYRVTNEMLGLLRQSHLELSGPGAAPSPTAAEPGDEATSDETGDPGLTVRAIEGRPTITAVRPGSSADRAGLKPGYLVTHIGGRPIKAAPPARALRPVEERFYVRLAAARALQGPVGTRVSIRALNFDDQPVDALLPRDPPQAKPVKIGLLPPLYPDVRVSRVDDVGIIAFNLFLLEGVLPAVQRAIDAFRQSGAKALVLDLRGNPGGLGAMAIPVASRLTDKPLVLGTIQFRDHAQTLTASPSLGVEPFRGPVVLVTDEGTASTSEMLAAGLQEAKRAIVVGDATLGAVLPSMVESLPGGAVLQYVVADFRTPKGVLVEGRGVQPDKRVIETRAGLRTGRDPVLDAALIAARSARTTRGAR